MISLRYKALVPSGLLGAVLVTLTTLAHFAINQLTETNVSLAGRYHEIEEVRQIEINVSRLVYPIVAAVTSGSAEARQEVKEKLSEIRDSVEELRQMAVVNSGERERLDNLENRLSHIDAITDVLLGLPAEQHALADAMLQDLSSYQLAPLSELIHSWHNDEERQVNALHDGALAVSERFSWWVGVAAASLAVLLIFALWLNNRILVRPVMTISRSTSKLAAGELGAAIKLRTNDELSRLALDINNMAASLQSVHSRLESMARTDALTGLPNRRALEETAARELEAARRYRRKLAVGILDLDHFKVVNDTHGHHVGDEVLRAVAQAASGALRQSDQCFRYGGEEFVLLLQETDEDGALAFMERCRQKLAATVIRVGELELKITASFGAACYPGDAQTLESLLELADAALYAAKSDGRNRCYTHASRVVSKAPDPALARDPASLACGFTI